VIYNVDATPVAVGAMLLVGTILIARVILEIKFRAEEMIRRADEIESES
jgi:hypothetical protein